MTDQILKTLSTLENEFNESIKEIRNNSELESLRIRFLGRKGQITHLFKSMGTLPVEKRKIFGQQINNLKAQVHKTILNKKNAFDKKGPSISSIDTTLPGNRMYVGRYHPITSVLRLIKSCFRRMGFTVAQGPEVETDYYNFEALNLPKEHPSRDMQDTLYIQEDIVLRTHTSPVQVRVMESQSPPVRIISPGRCYRKDTPDSTHTPYFHQVEGLCVDKGISFADLKSVILTFAKQLMGSDMKIRFRPGFFPFTEPSAEYDFLCPSCRGKGCRVCKGTGWIEISGAGMVNPAVFKYVNYDSEKYTGYAFGMGAERIAMVLYGINDIRLFYENDIRFLHQF